MISQQQQGGTTVMAWNAHITFKDGPENCFWDPHIQDGVLSMTVWEIVPEIHIWSGARSCYGSNSPGHSQHVQKWSGQLFMRSTYGLEQDHVMAVIVQNIHNTSKNGLGNCS